MSESRFNPQTRRRRASAPAKFAIGVALAIGATMGADQAAFSRSSKSERLSAPRNAGGETIELAELSKRATAYGTMDSHPADGARTGTAPYGGRPDLQFVREDGPDLAPRDVVGAPGKPAPLPIKLSAARLSEGSLLTFRGLPDSVKLSAGFRFQEAWAVSLKDASGLTLLPDPDYEGVFSVEVCLMKKQETATPDKQTIRVTIRSGRVEGASAFSIGSGPTTGAESPAAPSIGLAPATQPKIPATEEAAMVERASGLLQSGDVAAARLIYERLARRGSSQGALALARTYDPESLRSLAVVGLKPDIAKAKEWYKKAAELGSKEAVKRLAVIETSLQ